MSLERDYTNDYEDWLMTQPPAEQGEPEPPGGQAAPVPPTNTNAPTTPNTPTTPGNTTPRRNPKGQPPYPAGPGEVWTWYDDWDDGKGGLGGWFISGGRTDGPPPPNGGDTGGGGVSYGGGSSALSFDPYESAGPFTPRDDTFEFTPFSYDPYTASSWEDAEKEPGYEASRKQLKNQIEGGAAYRGMLRSGMTLKDIYTGLDSLGQQNFANFDNRRFRNYSANRDGAFQAWSGNLGAAAQKFALELGVDKDIYDRKATDVDRGNNYRFNTAQATAQDALARWQEQVRSLTQISTAGMNS